MKEKVAIIIATYSQDKLLERNLNSIKNKNRGKSYRIFLVDDASENDIGEKIKNKFPFVNVIRNKKNLGFSKSNNLGILKAKKEYNPDWFLIYNDDCEMNEENFIERFVEKAQKFQGAGIFGCKLIYSENSIQWGTKKGKNYFFEEKGHIEKNNEFSKTQKTTEIIGACMLIRKEVFEKIGLFDEKFSPFYGEESDLCFRAKKEEYEIFYIGNLTLIHHRGKSISKLSKDEVWFIKKKNSIRLEFKHYNLLKIFYYGLVHFASIFKKDGIGIGGKLNLLIKAYAVNFKKN